MKIYSKADLASFRKLVKLLSHELSVIPEPSCDSYFAKVERLNSLRPLVLSVIAKVELEKHPAFRELIQKLDREEILFEWFLSDIGLQLVDILNSILVNSNNRKPTKILGVIIAKFSGDRMILDL